MKLPDGNLMDRRLMKMTIERVLTKVFSPDSCYNELQHTHISPSRCSDDSEV